MNVRDLQRIRQRAARLVPEDQIRAWLRTVRCPTHSPPSGARLRSV